MRLGKTRLETKYMAVKHYYETKGWSIRWMCKALRISRSGYFKWLSRPIPKAEQENNLIAQLIMEYDERFGHILGYRRMTSWINRLNGTSYSRKRIRRIMRKLGIHSVIRQKRKKYLKSNPQNIADNILKRDFSASRPNEKWVTDVTEFKWYEDGVARKLYLSAILDLYDRSIVAYEISTRNDNSLVLRTFEKAIKANPEAKPIFHSDRGFQYTSRTFKIKLDKTEMIQSMSRVARCIDNGPMEGFWGIVKAEMIHLYEITDGQSLRKAIDNYVNFYNNERFQDRFGTKTPMEVREEAFGADIPAQYPISVNKRIQSFKAKFVA